MVNVGGTGSHGLRFAIGEVAPTAYVFVGLRGRFPQLAFSVSGWGTLGQGRISRKTTSDRHLKSSRGSLGIDWGTLGAHWESTGAAT